MTGAAWVNAMMMTMTMMMIRLMTMIVRCSQQEVVTSNYVEAPKVESDDTADDEDEYETLRTTAEAAPPAAKSVGLAVLQRLLPSAASTSLHAALTAL